MLSKYSVKRPFTVLVGVVIALVLGYLSFTNMSTDLLPNMEFPYAIVMTTYPGASPEEVERAVSVPVEQSMAAINNVKEIQSMSVNNMSIVIMEFNDGTDMGSTVVDMRESLDQVTSKWEDGIGNPTIMKINPDMMPVMVAAMSYDDKSSAEVTKLVEENILPEIESVNGVATVNKSGEVEEKVDVIIQQDKLDKMNKKVQDAISGKLDKASKKINKGKDKIKDGKETLNQKKEEAAEKIASGEKKLNQASSKISEGLKTIETNIANIKTQRKTIVDSEKKVKSGLVTIAVNIKKLETTIKTLKLAETQFKTAKSGLSKLTSQISSLQSQVDSMGSEAPEELTTALNSLKAQKNVILEGLKKNGVTEENIESKYSELSKGLATAQGALTQLKAKQKELKKTQNKLKTAKNKIDAGIKKLNDAKIKLQNGKITTEDALEELNKQKMLAGISMSVAETKLNSGEEKLSEASKQFDDTKKTTKENADLKKIITKEMVENILKAENFDMPSGYVTEDNASYLVRVGDKVDDVKNISKLVICDMGIDDLDPIRLEDVADVVVTDNSEDVYTVVNGNPAVSLTINKQSGFSTGDLSKRLVSKIEDLKETEKGLNATILMNQGVYIDFVVDAVIQNLAVGGILAILILFLFLWDLRPTIIVACSIPLSVVVAIVCMYFSHVTLNIISLSGLALGVGMLVDNSVVVIENIFRLLNKGYSRRHAAVEGAKQVAGAIAASTLTTVCVFAPIIFTEGITKQLFVDLSLTLAYTLLASLLIALTLVPAMAAGLMKVKKTKGKRFLDRVQVLYGKMLKKALRFKAVVLVVSVVLLVLFIGLAAQNGTTMMPEMKSTQMTITMDTEDKEVKEVKDISNAVIDKLKEIPDVKDVGAFIGGGSTMSMLSGGDKNSVTMYVLLSKERKLDNKELKATILDKTKDLDCELEVNASAMDMSSLTGKGVSVRIKGRDLDKLRKISEDLMTKLKSVDGLLEISNGLEDSDDEFRISIDKAKAMKYSLTVAQVYQDIYGRLKEASSATTVSTDTKDIGIYVKASKDDDLTREKIKNLKIEYTDASTQKKKSVKLSKIASFSTGLSPATISRREQSRFVTVSADIDENHLVNEVSANVKKVIDAYKVPAGYTIEFDGEDATTQEAMTQVLLMMALGVLLMYLIMVAQFQSLLSPFIILFTIPLAFTGGFMGLWFTGSQISVIAMIGLVMLSGIIVNNGIVLVDYINQQRRSGVEKKEAIVDGGQTRLRPILMTALTTILGLIPMAVSNNMGSDMSRPMAIVTIGGLTYGTLLTLFVVPCIYDLLNRKKDITEKDITDGDAEDIELE